ncbi:hypothetical protein AJ80_08466 [Polytolypa hystricis UAMH7299]|uniref:A to I editase domain-containing protein n=1 Tax=Polytolypa hystricis (strain UAMH7299) TaxID=1447883 RepID=A0A2B7X817_POLH7|nr:hypothetical protein AJ80_08466 [Polytolypa hystricis UAMH7299]
MGEESSLEYRIASLVHSHFNALPKRSKPAIHPNGIREWIPLSGIVLVIGEGTPEETLTCVAIATGAKCLSSSQIPQCRGLVLHDSHAEILAIRAFNRWLLEECKSTLLYEAEVDWQQRAQDQVSHDVTASDSNPTGGTGSGTRSQFVQLRLADEEVAHTAIGGDTDAPPMARHRKLLWPPFKLREDLKIWMYCTCAPCGDASMELCMAAQDDPTPWAVPPSSTECTESGGDPAGSLLDGRGYFSILGVVRRKPSRADAESTLSKSCSDKLAAKQVTSLLSFTTSLLVAPTSNAYISRLLLPEEEVSQAGCERAFGSGTTGRLKPLNGQTWDDTSVGGVEYGFRPFEIRTLSARLTEELWMFGKPKDTRIKSKPGNAAAIWTAQQSVLSTSTTKLSNAHNSLQGNLCETIINGTKQGHKFASPSPRKASAVSRAKMWDLLRDIVKLLPTISTCEDPGETSTSANKFETEIGGSDDSAASSDLLFLDKLKQIIAISSTYEALKENAADAGLSSIRNRALSDLRNMLGNWVRNIGDEGWGLGVLKEEVVKKPHPRSLKVPQAVPASLANPGI